MSVSVFCLSPLILDERVGRDDENLTQACRESRQPSCKGAHEHTRWAVKKGA